MSHASRPGQRWSLVAAMVAALLTNGCHSAQIGSRDWAPPSGHLDPKVPAPPADVPRELSKVTLPDYIIEPPDILLIDAVKVVPKPPYRIESLDQLSLQVAGALPDRPIEGEVMVEPGGLIDLGPPYGTVRVAGMGVIEAQEAIRQHLLEFLKEPEVSLRLVQSASAQQIIGERMVGPDGKVTLGTYGKVYITGMTQMQAKQAIEQHLAQYLEAPQVAVDIFAYNSKVYYVIMEGAGQGDSVSKFSITGNETVLDALAEINGMQEVSSKRIWVARPAPYGSGYDQVLPVDWHALAQRGDPSTNYQLLPGDRVFIAQDRLMATGTALSKVSTPMMRIFGTTLMGTFTAKGIKFFGSGSGGGI
ncbi:MAG TPA: polysaccharide biosynthesis/export family protein [Pirellulales bacterium]|nr:polysaccharide biosynthesis/export family protein [Pirellulales bacterium]